MLSVNFSFQPSAKPVKQTGTLNKKALAYKEYLAGEMYHICRDRGFTFPKINLKGIIYDGAESLVRSNSARLERLVGWGMLTPADADKIALRSKEVAAEKITLMHIWFVAEHLGLGSLTTAQIQLAVKKMMPYHFLNYLCRTFKEKGITFADAWRFAAYYSSNPEEAIRKALFKAEQLFNHFKVRGVSYAVAKYFAIYRAKDPEGELSRALSEATRLTKRYKSKGVYPADAWHFILYYSSPEKGIQNTLNQAKRLSKKYKDEGLSYSDCWRIALHFPAKTEKVIKRVLKEAERLTETYDIPYTDAKYIAIFNPSQTDMAVKKALAEAERLKVVFKGKNIPFYEIWHFCVHHPENPEADLRKSRGL